MRHSPLKYSFSRLTPEEIRKLLPLNGQARPKVPARRGREQSTPGKRENSRTNIGDPELSKDYNFFIVYKQNCS